MAWLALLCHALGVGLAAGRSSPQHGRSSSALVRGAGAAWHHQQAHLWPTDALSKGCGAGTWGGQEERPRLMTHSICLVQSLPAKDALHGVYLRSAVCTRDAPSQDLSIYSSPNLFATYPGPVQSRLLTKWPSIHYFPGVGISTPPSISSSGPNLPFKGLHIGWDFPSLMALKNYLHIFIIYTCIYYI